MPRATLILKAPFRIVEVRGRAAWPSIYKELSWPKTRRAISLTPQENVDAWDLAFDDRVIGSGLATRLR
jgi:hypothetical protein